MEQRGGYPARLRAALALSEVAFCLPAPLGCAYQPCDCAGSGEVFVDAVTLTVHYYDASVTTTPLDWSIGLSQDDSHFRISPSPDLANPAIVATTAGNVGIAREPGFISTQFGPVFYRLDVNGSVRCTTLTQSSSRRFKQDVHPVDDALDKILALEGVAYHWDVDHGAKADFGFIAEDVGRVHDESTLLALTHACQQSIGLSQRPSLDQFLPQKDEILAGEEFPDEGRYYTD